MNHRVVPAIPFGRTCFLSATGHFHTRLGYPIVCINKLIDHTGVSRILSSKFRFIRVTQTLIRSASFIGGLTTSSDDCHDNYGRSGCYVNHVCALGVGYRRYIRGLPGGVQGRVRGTRERLWLSVGLHLVTRLTCQGRWQLHLTWHGQT